MFTSTSNQFKGKLLDLPCQQEKGNIFGHNVNKLLDSEEGQGLNRQIFKDRPVYSQEDTFRSNTMATLQVVLLFGLISLAYAASLTEIYNSQVTKAEYYTRPLTSSSSGSSSSGSSSSGSSSSGSWWRRKCSLYNHHAGVVVTTENGDRWLIHKGMDYGDTWDTVLTSADYMSGSWTRQKCGTVSGKTVNDFMIAGLIHCDYTIWTILSCNCQNAANGMWNLVSTTAC